MGVANVLVGVANVLVGVATPYTDPSHLQLLGHITHILLGIV